MSKHKIIYTALSIAILISTVYAVIANIPVSPIDYITITDSVIINPPTGHHPLINVTSSITLTESITVSVGASINHKQVNVTDTLTMTDSVSISVIGHPYHNPSYHFIDIMTFTEGITIGIYTRPIGTNPSAFPNESTVFTENIMVRVSSLSPICFGTSCENIINNTNPFVSYTSNIEYIATQFIAPMAIISVVAILFIWKVKLKDEAIIPIIMMLIAFMVVSFAQKVNGTIQYYLFPSWLIMILIIIAAGGLAYGISKMFGGSGGE